MVHINTKTYIDLHTTGERREFGSLKAYDKFLKENGARVVTKSELVKPKTSVAKSSNSNYKKVAEEAWITRHKNVREISEKIKKEQYLKRNGYIK